MLAVNAAVRASRSPPVAQLTSRACSGGRCCAAARAAAGAAAMTATARQASVACRRMGPLNSGGSPKVAPARARRRQVTWYSGPSPPSGGVSRPPLAVIAPHCTQFVGLTIRSTCPSSGASSGIS